MPGVLIPSSLASVPYPIISRTPRGQKIHRFGAQMVGRAQVLAPPRDTKASLPERYSPKRHEGTAGRGPVDKSVAKSLGKMEEVGIHDA